MAWTLKLFSARWIEIRRKIEKTILRQGKTSTITVDSCVQPLQSWLFAKLQRSFSEDMKSRHLKFCSVIFWRVKNPGALLLIIWKKRRCQNMSLNLTTIFPAVCLYILLHKGSSCDRSFLWHFEKPWGIKLGSQIDHQFMNLINNRALASNTYLKEEKKRKGAIHSFSPSLCILQHRKYIREYVLLKKHTHWVFYLPFVSSAEICIALKFVCILCSPCVRFFWRMVTMVNFSANSSERKSKEAEKM